MLRARQKTIFRRAYKFAALIRTIMGHDYKWANIPKEIIDDNLLSPSKQFPSCGVLLVRFFLFVSFFYMSCFVLFWQKD